LGLHGPRLRDSLLPRAASGSRCSAAGFGVKCGPCGPAGSDTTGHGCGPGPGPPGPPGFPFGHSSRSGAGERLGGHERCGQLGERRSGKDTRRPA